jgi:methylenetetrahydrofolate reductase (NADPH)
VKAFKDTLRSSEFAITAELSLAPTQSPSQLVEQALALAAVSDAVQIPDHLNARPHITPVAAAAHLLPYNIETIARLNCRDRNRVAIQSEILSARSFGISNLLISRGSNFAADHTPPSSEVHDLTAIDLIRTAAAIRDGEVMAYPSSATSVEFFIGAVATAFKPKNDWQPEKLLAKADAGAQFIQLQMCMNVNTVRSYVARLVDARLTWRFQVLASVSVFQSVKAARELRRATAGSVIPSAMVGRLKQAKDPESEGIRIAAETLQLLKDVPGISGANVQTTGDPALIVAAIQASGLRSDVGT